MQSVPAPHLVVAPSGGRRAALRVALALALAAGLAVALSLATARDAGQPARPLSHPSIGALIGGVPLQQASCAQWTAADAGARQRTAAALAAVAGGASTGGGRGATLTSAEASALFARVCAAPFARGFLLYEIYNRAAAFKPQSAR